jgi:activator of HSP90 ATPase
LQELFEYHVIEVPTVGNVVLLEVEKCEGEARANNRKGKLIFFYEWEITVKWKGNANGNDTEVTGKIDIPNLSEEHDDMDDVDIDVSLTTKGPESTVLKEMLRKGPGAKKIRALLSSYVSQLKNEYAQGLVLPKKGSEAAPTAKSSAAPKPASRPAAANGNEVGMKALDLGGCKLELAEVKIEENMKCTGQELYNALTQRDMIQIFTGSEAKMAVAGEAGGNFELLGGNITGQFIELVPFTKIVQSWRLKSWPQGVTSTVTISIKQTKEDTKVSIVQTGVPAKEVLSCGLVCQFIANNFQVESTREGWQRYYFHAMKRSFGFGASLF